MEVTKEEKKRKRWNSRASGRIAQAYWMAHCGLRSCTTLNIMKEEGGMGKMQSHSDTNILEAQKEKKTYMALKVSVHKP